MFFEHQLNMYSAIKLSNASPACHEGLREKLQFNQMKPSFREARWKQISRASKIIQSSKELHNVLEHRTRCSGTLQAQDFAKVEKFYFTKRSGKEIKLHMLREETSKLKSTRSLHWGCPRSLGLIPSFLSTKTKFLVTPIIRPVDPLGPTGLFLSACNFFHPTGRTFLTDRSIFVNFLNFCSLLDRSIFMVRPVYLC